MQHMPDNEFDKLFRDKFKDAEIEPSMNLWANIEKELEPKRKKVVPIYWMAAATIAVAITAMLVFQKKEVIHLQGADPIAQVQPTTPTDVIATPDDLTQINDQAVKQRIAKVSFTTTKAETKTAVVLTTNQITEGTKNNQIAVQPNTNNDRLLIKPMDPKPLNVEPIKEQVVVENPIVIASVQVNNKVEDVINENSSDRKGIRNVGDLVNFVVDKVDKRDKKLVRFNTDDDDNSSIVGINIGFLKFNKRNKN